MRKGPMSASMVNELIKPGIISGRNPKNETKSKKKYAVAQKRRFGTILTMTRQK